MKTMKRIVSVAMAGVMMMSLAGCGKNWKNVDKKAFKAALEDVADIDDPYDYGSYYEGSKHDIDAYYGDYRYEWIEFKDADDAMDFFEDRIYDYFEDMIDDDDFDGKYSYKLTDTYGYILVNGESDSDDFYEGDIYGGFYVRDNIVVRVYVRSDKEKKINKINEFLRAIGYPTP